MLKFINTEIHNRHLEHFPYNFFLSMYSSELKGGITDTAPAAKASFVRQDASHRVPVRPRELSAPECLALDFTTGPSHFR